MPYILVLIPIVTYLFFRKRSQGAIKVPGIQIIKKYSKGPLITKYRTRNWIQGPDLKTLTTSSLDPASGLAVPPASLGPLCSTKRLCTDRYCPILSISIMLFYWTRMSVIILTCFSSGAAQAVRISRLISLITIDKHRHCGSLKIGRAHV